MPFNDLFTFFRWMLSWIVTIYATIVTVQSLWGWYVWLAGPDRYIGMVRRYMVVQGLRVRVFRFGGDVLICVLLCVVFLMLWRAHHIMYDIAAVLK